MHTVNAHNQQARYAALLAYHAAKAALFNKG